MSSSANKSELSTDSLKTAKQWHLYLVLNDSEFVTRVNQLLTPPPVANRMTDSWRQPYRDLADEYGITYLDVYLYKNHGMNAMLVGADLLPRGLARYNASGDVIELVVPKTITQPDFYELWEQIKAIKSTELGLRPTKRKPPADPQLIYAIFKARKRGHTFREIFRLYEAGDLEYYPKTPHDRFGDEDALETYYHKYQPIT